MQAIKKLSRFTSSKYRSFLDAIDPFSCYLPNTVRANIRETSGSILVVGFLGFPFVSSSNSFSSSVSELNFRSPVDVISRFSLRSPPRIKPTFRIAAVFSRLYWKGISSSTAASSSLAGIQSNFQLPHDSPARSRHISSTGVQIRGHTHSRMTG